MTEKVLRGQAYWACIRKPNDMSGKLQMDIGNLDKASQALCSSHDIPLKDKGDDRGKFITLKGNPEYLPRVTDSQNNQIPEPVSLGNGSKVKVPFKPYEWNFKGTTGWSVGLNSIMVVEMVHFDSFDAMAAEDGGYVAPVQMDLAQVEMEEEPF
jgi:hypothetical protein